MPRRRASPTSRVNSGTGRPFPTQRRRAGSSPAERVSGCFTNRVAWACTYLNKAGVLERPGRGLYRITDRGRSFVASTLGPITANDLATFPEFNQFRAKTGGITDSSPVLGEEHTPEEVIERAAGTLRATLAAELLDRVHSASPQFFERLVIDLLLAMGYGGSRSDAGRAVGRSGDRRNRRDHQRGSARSGRRRHPGQEVGTIGGRPEIQMFAGSLDGHRSTKGVFLTTSAFTEGARTYASSIGKRIVLDRRPAARLPDDRARSLCSTVALDEVKRVDESYFEGG